MPIQPPSVDGLIQAAPGIRRLNGLNGTRARGAPLLSPPKMAHCKKKESEEIFVKAIPQKEGSSEFAATHVPAMP